MKVLYYYLKCFCIVGYVNAVCQTNRIEIDGNGYKGITVAVSSKLDSSEIQIQRLKDLFTAASARLYRATKHHVFFKDITIVVPKSLPIDTDGYINGPQIDSAHVIVDKANPLANNKPYVSGMTGCGKPGRHIHLEPYTLEYLPAVGNADRLFVHHWGHFRWGLFDEHGDTESPVQGSNTNTWFYSSGGTYKPNICVKNTKGKSELNYCGSNMKCSVDENGLPEKNCKFCGDETGNTVNGSIMGNIEISSVEEFCDEENSTVPHNEEAETPQNKICQGKSAWEIMRLHSDFKDTTPGAPSQNTTPTFRIVKQRSGQNFVLVLDKSGSMTGAKMKELKEVSSIFITNWLTNGSSVGVVAFDTTARIVSSLKLVTSDEVRKSLVKLLDRIGAGGSTSIGTGLRKGIEVLKTSGESIEGNEIILVSDGENTNTPGIKDVKNEILAEHVSVTTVAIGKEADKDMENLAKESGGSSHFYSGKNNSTALIDSFIKIAECASDDDNKMYQIESKSLSVLKGQNYSTVVYVDSTLGLDTVLLLQGPDVSYISASLIGPGNRTWTSDTCTDSCRIQISGLAEVGTYTVQISSIADMDMILTLIVHSFPRDPSEEVFTATAWISTESFDFSPSTPIVLYALVMKGSSPVLDAHVSMNIEDSEGEIIPVNLLDNGLGEDIIKGDGLYTGVMLPSQIKVGGRHSLKLIVTGKSGETKILVPKVKRRKRETQTEDTAINLETKTVDEFQRVESSGSFTVYNYSQVNITNDIISPARITTLQVMNRNDISFNVSWNAVGDDVIYGKALLYNILLSKNLSTLRNSPETVEPLTRNIPTPSDPGSLELFSLALPEVNANYYLAVRAVDEAGNKGDVSNILSLSVITDSTWEREKLQSPSSSNEVLIIAVCAAALVLIAIVVFGCIIYNKRKSPGKGAGVV
ncbi:calcium-activated chloride channel regulator 1-like isoform X2 [Saccostrea echinata]|uniref:calcium-activated chloride channel regulator 1-like isoform X2 n=1 Tax=Saccostrea echinata TaxID=191078 RepID=UPI002A8278CD|nr:calcium-activated chloride channel regulator 1-like isoform X2 [Saccostrea echinata]